MMWGEYAERPRTVAGLMRPVIALWYASWQAGHWSTPLMVMSGRTINWRQPEALSIDTAGNIHVAVAGALGPGFTTLHYLRRDAASGTWRHTSGEFMALAASLAVIGADSVLIAYVGLDTAASGGRGSMFTTRLRQDASRLPTGSPVRHTDSSLALYPQVRSRGRGFDLVWIETKRGSAPALVVARQGGNAPLRVDTSIALTAQPTRVVAAASDCETAVLVELRTSPDGAALLAVSISSKSITAFPAFSAALVATNVGIASGGPFVRAALDIVRTPDSGATSVLSQRRCP
jgi:hypothetical protein